MLFKMSHYDDEPISQTDWSRSAEQYGLNAPTGVPSERDAMPQVAGKRSAHGAPHGADLSSLASLPLAS